MNLDTYFRQKLKGNAKPNSEGKPTAWMDFCKFRLRGPKFLIADASFLPSRADGLLVKARPGEYLLQAQVVAYGKDRRISRLRAVLKRRRAKLGRKLGETWTDTATTAICDFKVFSQAWGDDDDASYAKIEKALEAADNHGIAVLDAEKGVVAPFVTSGFGDGTYPVFALQEQGKRVGFEIEFIPAGTPYPFGPCARTSKSSKRNASDQSQDSTPRLMDLFSKAFEQTKKSGSITAALKEMEDELRREGETAAVEYRQHIREMRGKASPPRMNFAPVPDESVLETPEVLRRAGELKAAGFVEAGAYESDGLARSKIAGFVHPALRLSAAISLTTQGTVCDVYADYADGTSFCVTDNTSTGWMSGPPWRTIIRKPFRSMGQLLRYFLKQVPKRERLPVSAEEFARRLTPDGNRYLDWFNDRGGLSEVELKALAKQKKNPRATDKKWIKERQLESADRALFNWLRIQPRLPFSPNAVSESLIIVHDGLTNDLLRVPYFCVTGDYKVRESDFAEGTPREAFSRVNSERGGKLRKVAEKITGLAADYYLPAT